MEARDRRPALCVAVLLADGCHGTMKSGSQNSTDSGHGSGGY